ncbi:MAG: DUF1289 domain-containing protein [Gammaproteobacteria bacterium]|nr:DUF1289 domain-containing protein [Gammaproteobacteria bacterium]
MNDPVASPCVRNCCLDDNDICIGCGRSLEDIRRWSDATENEKRDILLRAADRCAARQDRYGGHGPLFKA